MKCVKVFGAEVSGTKFLIDLLKLNTTGARILDHEMGYKHGIPLTIEEIQRWFKTEKRPDQELMRIMRSLGKKELNLYPIIIIKNPYLWYKDVSNYRGKKNFDFDREYQIYNSSYNIYKDLIENNQERYGGLYTKGLFVKYEYLLKYPAAEINRISILCGLRMSLTKNFVVPDHINKRKKEFYIKGPPWKLNEVQLNNVKTRVDWDLVDYYGYEPIDVVEAYNSQYIKEL